MFNNLNGASVADVNESDLLAGFGDETPANDKTSGKTEGDDGKKTTAKTEPAKSASGKSGAGKASTTASAKTTAPAATVVDAGDKDVDDAFGTEEGEGEDEEEAKKKAAKAKEAKGGKKGADEGAGEEDTDADGEEDQDGEEEEDDEKEKDEEDDADAGVDVKDFLKARVNLLLSKGEWKAFEVDGKKGGDVEWTEDSFAEMELQQREWQRTEMRDEILDSFGPYGRDIAEYAAKGGDPDRLIEIFQEQQRVQATDISTEDGQKAVVFEHQTKVLGKSADSANRFIKNLIADNELAAEAKETKDLLDKSLSDEKDALMEEAETARKAQEKAIKDSQSKFATSVTEYLTKAEGISAEEKKEISKALTKFDKKLKNGADVNDFYFKFADFKKDLPNYINLVRLVLNPDRFLKAQKNEGKTENADKVFKITRTNAMNRKVKTTAPDGGAATKKSGFKLL